MVLVDIDIDDRDTVNYFGGPGPQGPVMAEALAAKFKEWLVRLKAEAPAGSIVHSIGGGNYSLSLPVIACTGAAVETILNVPFMHELYKIETKHVDSSLADSSDAMTYSYSHKINGLWLLMLSVTGTTASDIVDQYVDYYHVRGEYKISVDTTNTDQVFVVFYFKILGE